MLGALGRFIWPKEEGTHRVQMRQCVDLPVHCRALGCEGACAGHGGTARKRETNQHTGAEHASELNSTPSHLYAPMIIRVCDSGTFFFQRYCRYIGCGPRRPIDCRGCCRYKNECVCPVVVRMN